ncbi:alpha/beta hydrolase fold protein [Xylanimonas cellulosilytica DSM 15894]|uniref:Alpha/beta hydrolase fold protein n=1 Tax=Xylanimonas cellulosilytica (strain DSM 15894 / JCM 12276 / CECT 5975 / KCTC 9989 / LMG 20990 / NBRC 107835 / XIL07) TaxID=446471 RepID=D1BRF9_XYLCX|nr:alpha/beta hydrolase [Xylanimonas cellulosilytica]ACZ30414.1 alpha/beta hydrolase fold protein [Xylanimonas cellulosilytica DSM 15894]
MAATFDESTRRVATRLGHLHVRIVGQGPTAVLWPSMFVDTHTFDPLIPYLAEVRSLVLIDPPGLGKSDPLTRATSMNEVADAARDAFGELGIDGPVDFVGNAYGGHLGYKLARDHDSLRSLVAISAPPEPNPPSIIRMTRLSLLLMAIVGRGPLLKPVGAKLLTAASVRDPDIWRVFRKGFLAPTRRSLANATRSVVLRRADVRGELGDIVVPSLYVASDQRGEWAPEAAERAAAMTPGARLAVVTGASTLVPLEQPEALARLILDFWATLGRERSA